MPRSAPQTLESPWPTILISGGHITPALATIEYLQEQYPEIRIVFVGREFTQTKERQPAKERELMAQRGIPFYATQAPKFHRKQWWNNIEEITKIVPAFWNAWHILRKERVSLFLSFGGYLAVPFAMMAKLLGKSVITHEQTVTTGLANELIGFVADKVAVSHEASRRFFPKHKTVLTGNPIRPSLLKRSPKKPDWLPPSNKPILYITGGSQGSQIINRTVAQILPQLTEKFVVLHQCGQSEHQHYLRELEEVAADLPPKLQDSYLVREWVEEQEVSWILHHAALAISRSGANTTLEMSIHALPAIFVPLPFAHNNEQYKNAQVLAEQGAATLLEQKDLTAESLWDQVQLASAQRAHMRRRAEKMRDDLRTDGAERLGELCLTLLRSQA